MSIWVPLVFLKAEFKWSNRSEPKMQCAPVFPHHFIACTVRGLWRCVGIHPLLVANPLSTYFEMDLFLCSPVLLSDVSWLYFTMYYNWIEACIMISEVKDYQRDFLPPVTAQLSHNAAVAASLLEQHTTELSVAQEWYNEWNSQGLLSRLTPQVNH